MKGEVVNGGPHNRSLARKVAFGKERQNPHIQTVPPLSTTISWGLGWGIQQTAAGISFWHWGDNGDTKAYVVAFPSRKSAVVMFANGTNGLSIIREVVDDAIGGQQPALSWIKYDSYNSPARLMLKAILKSDAETILVGYRKHSLTSDNLNQLGHQGPNPGSQGNGSITTKDKIPSTISLTEQQMNTLGYQLLSLKRLKDAIAVFTQNTIDYPTSFNTWDSLGEGYMESGDKVSAIKYYKKSLELNPDNTNAVQKLKELGG